MNPSTIDPLALPSLPLLERRHLPKCPAIYFALEGNKVLYIGRTNNLNQRWTIHHRWQQLQATHGEVRIAWLECSNISLLSSIEDALIEHFQPLLNGSAVVPTALVASKLPSMSVYIEPELKAAAEKLAKKQKRSLSSLVCILLEEAVQIYERAK